jgi:putative restriction endonuclease
VATRSSEWRQAARLAAFDYAAGQSRGGELPIAYSVLTSFSFDGEAMPLIGQKGIWKPRVLDLPISIITAAPKIGVEPPYPDEMTPDGRLLYRYEGTDPQLWTNVRLRRAMELGVPVLYMRGIVRGLYMVEGALIVEDDPANLTFTVYTAPLESVAAGLPMDMDAASHRYYVRTVKQRVDQQAFRGAVLQAYRTRCAVCRLKHPELLDAAHIVAHADGGKAIVPNGLSMCKIHHAAFDANILGVRPDLVLEIREDILDEVDGPMLRHGLQEMHGGKLLVPQRAELQPNPDYLNLRYSAFIA